MTDSLSIAVHAFVSRVSENGFELTKNEAEDTPQKQLPMPTTQMT